MSTSKRTLKEVSISSLFGIYNHHIKLNTNGITVIHGQNGVGKTSILTLIFAFFDGKWGDLTRYPYDELRFIFDDNSILYVKNTEHNSKNISIEFTYCDQFAPINTQDMDIENYATRLERKKHFLDRITPDLWFDASTGNTLTASEVVRSYGSFDEGIAKKYPWLIELKNSISVSFIKTQRLEARKFFTSPPWHPERRRKNNSVINLCAEKMKGIVATALSDYGKISQNLDQSFPNRLLEKNTPTFSKSDLKLKMNSIEEFREKLKEIKLLGEENSIIYDKIDIDELSDTHLKVLSTYVDDTQKKLDTLRSLSRKVEVMLNKINKKFNHKKLEIDPEFGISVFDKDNKRLSLDVLSSGEQHEIVLVFDLLFNSPDGALILIDEPEISLHISWQREFLDDLMDIVQLNNMEVIIATHSPNIIDKHYDLMVELSSKIEG